MANLKWKDEFFLFWGRGRIAMCALGVGSGKRLVKVSSTSGWLLMNEKTRLGMLLMYKILNKNNLTFSILAHQLFYLL